MKVPEPRKMSSGNWYIQLRLGGKSVSVTAATAKDCKREAMLIKAEYLNGKRKILKGEPLTLKRACEIYLDKRSNVLSPSTRRGYDAIKRNYFQPEMAMDIRGKVDWQAMVNREAARLSAKTLKNAWGFIKSVLKDNGIEPPKIQLPQIVEKETPFLDPEEIQIFVAAVKGKTCEIPALLALHSLRRSEIFALDWNHVDLKNKTIKIAGGAVFDEKHKLVQKPTNKNRSSARTLPIMIPELLSALEAVEDKTGRVVRCHPNTLIVWVNRVCRESGLPKVGVHGLRHSFASLAYHLKISEMETMQLGGWSDMYTMRKIYTHISQKDKLRAQNKIAEFYKNANKDAM